MKAGHLLLGLLFVLVMVEVIVILPKDVGKRPSDEEEKDSSEEPDSSRKEQVMRGVHLVQVREGKKEWELWAEVGVRYKQKTSWLELKVVKVYFFRKNEVYFTVTGERGAIQAKNKDMVLRGNVRMRSANGYISKAELVEYKSAQSRIVAPKPVTIWGPKNRKGHSLFLRGQSLEVDLNNALMTVYRDVEGEKFFRKNKRLLIRSQRADLSGKSNLVRFSEEVVMDFETMRITGPQAVFEYENNTDLVESVQVSGGVKVSDLDKWATSQRLNIDFNRGRYIFRGNPEVVQNNGKLRGEEIVFLDDGRKVKILKARAKLNKAQLEKAN